MPRPQTFVPCPTCQIGRLREQKILFFDKGWQNPIVAAQFPGWSCDVCGERFYNHKALEQLRALIWTSHSQHRITRATTRYAEHERHPDREQRRRP